MESDARVAKLLRLLWDADHDAGVYVADLPAPLHDETVLTNCSDRALIEFGRRNHCHVGTQLLLEPGYSFTLLAPHVPDKKPPRAMLREISAENVEPEIRYRVRLSATGQGAAARLVPSEVIDNTHRLVNELWFAVVDFRNHLSYPFEPTNKWLLDCTAASKKLSDRSAEASAHSSEMPPKSQLALLNAFQYLPRAFDYLKSGTPDHAISDLEQAGAYLLRELDRLEKEYPYGIVSRNSKPKPSHRADEEVVPPIDYRSFHWDGTTFHFTDNQAAAVKILFEHMQRKTPDVGQATILTEIDSSAMRLISVFKNGKHNAWGTLIVPGRTKGTFRIADKLASKPLRPKAGKRTPKGKKFTKKRQK